MSALTDAATLAQWDAWIRSGERSAADIGAEAGISKTAVLKRVRRWRESQEEQPGVTPPSVQDGVIFPDLKRRADEDEWATRYLEVVIEQQTLERQRDNEQDTARAVIPDNKPVGVVFTGDWHIGNVFTEHQLLRDHLKDLRETDGLYNVGMGDYADWFTGRRANVAITNQQMKPAQQRAIAHDLLLRKTGGAKKSLAYLAGNHCFMPEELTGEDPVAEVAAEAGVPYLGFGGTLVVQLGEAEYKIAAWHSYPGGSAINPGNNQRRVRADYDNIDIVCLGHFHYNYAQDGTNREGRDYVDLRSGTFKIRDPRYAAMRVGTKGGDSRMPMVILFPNEKKVWHIRDYREWLPLLAWLRSGGA